MSWNLATALWSVIPKTGADIGHSEFWETTASRLVAEHYKIPQRLLANLPYCQRRARVAGNRVYYGEKPDAKLLRLIRKTLGNSKLEFVHDDHEKRLRARRFRVQTIDRPLHRLMSK